MRNLLGRLNARSATELDRIAAFWRVTLGQGERHSQVGSLYRSMFDPAAARDAWERLGAEEAALVRTLATGEVENAATLEAIAATLGVEPGAVRETAASLYRHGILAREGDGAVLPMGEAPRLFLPRELAVQFRRVLDEIDLGDTSSMPLSALVEWFDDGEIDDAAETWGVTVSPGGRNRVELSRRLLKQTADVRRLERVVTGLGPDAQRIWQEALGNAGNGPTSLPEARVATGLDGADPRSAERFRKALGELERAMLVWHTYRPDGSRWLFVPGDIRTPKPAPSIVLPPLAPVPEERIGDRPWRHPQAAAWDLLTLLRELSSAPWPAEGEAPRARLRSLNMRLWHHGGELPPAGYLPFLIALADAEGLVSADDGPPPALVVAGAIRQWRERSFPAQAERMRWWWLNSPEWIEGRETGQVEVWGVDWRLARRRLLVLLADPDAGISGGRWHTLESVAHRFAARDPELLGAAFTAATARQGGEAGGAPGPDEARAAATAEAIAVELSTACNWLGLVDIADGPGQPRAVRLTALGEEIARGGTPMEPEHETAAGPAMLLDAEGAVRLERPSALRVWALSALADQEALGRESRYRVTQASVGRALAAGFDLGQVTGFLEKQSGAALPDELHARFGEWARSFRRVRVRRVVALLPDDAAEQRALLHIASELGWPAEAGNDGAVLVQPPADASDPEMALLAALRSVGCSPVMEGGKRAVAPRRDRSRER
ncbi:MAG: helicase-associated domain-containing protein [Thermomicrobiales bacterium]